MLTAYLLPRYTTLVRAQDYCIECPATGSLFSIKDGSIQSWYPNNPVLRALTPKDTCRNMEVRYTLQSSACMHVPCHDANRVSQLCRKQPAQLCINVSQCRWTTG